MDLLTDIVEFIGDETGLNLDADASKKISGIISRQIKTLGLDSPDAYLKLLREEPDKSKLKNIITELTVGETYFFRNSDHWQALKAYVLPRIAKQAAAQNRSPRFWCSACASGEEAYTLAICIREAGLYHRFNAIKIYASDINYKSVAIARKGVFNSHSFRGKENVYSAYFKKTQKKYRINEDIRRAVTFMEFNLASKVYPSQLKSMDVIFCRNALMYFCPETVQEILKKIVNCLAKSGFLFLGHAEGSIVPFDMLQRIRNSNTFFFQNDETRIQQTALPKPGNLTKSFEETIESLKTGQHNSRQGEDRQQRFAVSAGSKNGKAKWPALPDGEQKETADVFNNALNLYCMEAYEKALGVLDAHFENYESSMNEIILAGMINLNMSRLDEARACREKALEKSDISPEGYCLEAITKEANADFNGAVQANRKSIFLDKDFFVPHFRLGQLYQKAGDVQKSRRSFLNGLKTIDKDSDVRIRLFFGILPKNKLKALCKEKCKIKKQTSQKTSRSG